MNEALNALDAILQSSAAGPQQYAPNSRYFGQPTTTLTAPDGTVISYLTRRFVPQPERFALLKQHTVAQGDRPDSIAAKYFNDPVQWWRLADANRVVQPEALTATIGQTVRVTLPEGVPLGSGKI
jgi:LysM domain